MPGRDREPLFDEVSLSPIPDRIARRARRIFAYWRANMRNHRSLRGACWRNSRHSGAHLDAQLTLEPPVPEENDQASAGFRVDHDTAHAARLIGARLSAPGGAVHEPRWRRVRIFHQHRGRRHRGIRVLCDRHASAEEAFRREEVDPRDRRGWVSEGGAARSGSNPMASSRSPSVGARRSSVCQSVDIHAPEPGSSPYRGIWGCSTYAARRRSSAVKRARKLTQFRDEKSVRALLARYCVRLLEWRLMFGITRAELIASDGGEGEIQNPGHQTGKLFRPRAKAVYFPQTMKVRGRRRSEKVDPPGSRWSSLWHALPQ